jgi:hypothetical protein
MHNPVLSPPSVGATPSAASPLPCGFAARANQREALSASKQSTRCRPQRRDMTGLARVHDMCHGFFLGENLWQALACACGLVSARAHGSLTKSWATAQIARKGSWDHNTSLLSAFCLGHPMMPAGAQRRMGHLALGPGGFVHPVLCRRPVAVVELTSFALEYGGGPGPSEVGVYKG